MNTISLSRLLDMGQLLEAAELTEYAARAAARELAINWESALGDGAKLDDLVLDVDRTIDLLHTFRNNVLANCPTEFRKE